MLYVSNKSTCILQIFVLLLRLLDFRYFGCYSFAAKLRIFISNNTNWCLWLAKHAQLLWRGEYIFWILPSTFLSYQVPESYCYWCLVLTITHAVAIFLGLLMCFFSLLETIRFCMVWLVLNGLIVYGAHPSVCHRLCSCGACGAASLSAPKLWGILSPFLPV